MKINKLRVALYGTWYIFNILIFIFLILLFFIEFKSSNLLEFLLGILLLCITWMLMGYPSALFINYCIIDKGKYFHVDKDSRIITFKTKDKCREIPLSDIEALYWVKSQYRHIAPSYFIITFHNHPPILLTSLMISIEKLEKELKTGFYVTKTTNLFITDESH